MKRAHRLVITYGLLTVIGIVMVYPLLWMISASFKTNREIFSSLSLLPTEILWDGYSKGWQSSGQYTFATYFANTFVMVIPTVLLTVASSLPVAYGFARFRFKGKGLLFALVIASLMLPTEVIIIPRYMLFNKLGWLNTYLPFIVPAAFATYSFFIFMLVQFMRGISRELEEAAEIDGCNSFKRLIYVVLPMVQPSLVSCALFQFMWSSNDFMGPLIYLNSTKKFTASLGLRMIMDTESGFDWNKTLALSVITLIPSLIIFFLAQDQFVEGIAAGGVKG